MAFSCLYVLSGRAASVTAVWTERDYDAIPTAIQFYNLGLYPAHLVGDTADIA